jgi:hypothetical protein
MPSATGPAKRNPALVVVDIVGSVLLVFTGIAFGLTALSFGGAFVSLPGTLPVVAGYGLICVAVLAFFLTTGMAIVNLIRRRYTFWWPLIGVVVTVLAIYGASALAGAGVTA